MKYQQGKIKREHGVMKEFEWLLAELQKCPSVTRLIPGRISRQQKWSSDIRFTIQYPTLSGRKCLMKKGSTAQELFIIWEEGWQWSLPECYSSETKS